MSGQIRPTSPWSRTHVKAIDPDVLAELEASIPDGHYITVGARTKPGDWSIRLVEGIEGSGDVRCVAELFGARTIENGVRGCLYQFREGVVA